MKLTVKNTGEAFSLSVYRAMMVDYLIGHDYLGRSAAPSTLQVNTHTMDEISYVSEFVPQGSAAAPVPALTLGAGAQLHNSMHLSARR